LFFRALDIRTFLENVKMSSSLSKILETGINVFKSNYQIIKNKKNIMKYYLYTNASKNNRWLLFVIFNDFLELNWFLYDPSWVLQLSEFVWTLRSSVLVVFNNFLLIDATDRSKISINKNRLFFAVSLNPLSFFANTPFNYKYYVTIDCYITW